MAASSVTGTTETNFTYPTPKGSPNPAGWKPATPKALSPENNKSALIFPLATAALSATLAFAGRSDQQRIFGAVTSLTLLGEAAFTYAIRNKKTVIRDYDWPTAMKNGTISAIVTGGLLADLVHLIHLRPNNALTFKKVIYKTGILVLTELALKYILNYSKSKMRTRYIQTGAIGIRMLAIAAYTGFLITTR